MHLRMTQNLPVDVSTISITAENSRKAAHNSIKSVSKRFDVFALHAFMSASHKLSRCRPDKHHFLLGQCAERNALVFGAFILCY